MTEERSTPLRQQMIEDMRIRGMGEKAQQAHIRAIKDFAASLGRSPDLATSEELHCAMTRASYLARAPRRSAPRHWPGLAPPRGQVCRRR